MSTSVNFNLAKLQEYSKQRWFKTNEIYQLLKNVENSNLRQAAIKKLPEKPTSGSFFFIEGSAGNRKWKHDGHAYVKRSNGVGFREDVVYLKIGGVKEIMCSYSYLDPNIGEQFENPLCRRIYKLVNKGGERQIYFVHYFNEKSISDTQSDRVENLKESSLGETPCSIISTSDEISKDSFQSPNNCPEFSDKLGDDFETYELPNKELDFISFDNEYKKLFEVTPRDQNNIFQEQPYPQEEILSVSIKKEPAPKAEEQKDEVKSAADMFDLTSKLKEIENKLTSLTIQSKKPVVDVPQLPHYDHNMMFNIIDYSPEWDYTKGGAKVLICISPLCYLAEAVNSKLRILFGDVEVSGYCLQPGVIKCFAPAHSEGFVKISLLLNGQLINHSGNHIFEYRKMAKKERKEKPSKRLEILDEDANSANSDFKVRVIEKMKDYSNVFSNVKTGTNGEILFRKYTTSDYKSCKNQPDFLMETDLLEILQFMVSNQDKNTQAFVKLANSLNRDGYSLIHYVSFLKYNDCLAFLLKNGGLPTISSSMGITPLEISIKLKNEKMLDILLENGALGPKKIDENLLNNQIPPDLDLISLYKDRNLIDMLIREVSLCDSLHNSMNMGMSDGEEDNDSYISWYDLLEEKDAAALRKEHPEKSDKPRQKRRENRKQENSRSTKDKNRPHTAAENANFNALLADNQPKIQKIQKNVRMWLLRRQYLDKLHATRVLQSYMRSKISKKKYNEESLNQLISTKVDDWLSNKKP